jgi:ABC-type nickel/cobalt efflux system permease component RcnA
VDSDGDGVASGVELQTWAARTAPGIAANLSVSVDGRPVALEVVSSAARERPGQGSLRTLRLEATFAGPVPPVGELAIVDGNDPDRVGWREITIAGADGTAIVNASVPARSLTDGLLSYPQDLLASPLDVREATVSFEPGRSAPAPASHGGPSAGRPAIEGGAFASLVERSGPFMLLALLLAAGFGALHALGPGHGKTLMAAYLVGAGGRFRHAVAVGGSVALMHTASVLALGFAVLTATELFAPERVYPWLGLGSGLIALGLGASLLVARLGAWARVAEDHPGPNGHAHPHGPAHAHPHGHGMLVEAHPLGHDHPTPADPVLSRRGLLALAMAGGMLPSPTALVVLLGAVAVDRIAYGLALIGAFSLGLAGALVAIGVGALRAKDALASRLSSRTARLMPVLSASAIAVLGVALSVRGLAQI